MNSKLKYLIWNDGFIGVQTIILNQLQKLQNALRKA